MSKAEHTPGPWVIDGIDCDTGGQHIMAENGNAICGLWTPGNTSCSTDEQAANARLIAEAPTTAAERDKLREVNKELLAALQLLLYRAECAVKDGLVQPLNGGIVIARVAVAKAKGE